MDAHNDSSTSYHKPTTVAGPPDSSPPSRTRPVAVSLPYQNHMLATDPGRAPTHHRTVSRAHPYLRTMSNTLHVEPSNVPIPVLASRDNPYPIFDIRRHYTLPSSPNGFGQTPFLPRPRMAMSAAHLSPPQNVKLDAKELQRRRLVRLFKIPAFFAVVREGWGDAIREQRDASASASTSAEKDRARRLPGSPSDTK
ncbi:hypothetical protein DXG01_000031 [Tephrocybe rancida]|nr:hypothetical protein DXG01_000031 [Tephrocybe rancida]